MNLMIKSTPTFFLYWKRLIEFMLYATLGISVFMFGAGFASGYTLLEVLTLLMFLNFVFYRFFMFSSPIKINPFALIIIVWGFFLAVQLVPLPVYMVHMLNPKLVTLYEKFAPERLSLMKIPLSLNAYSMWTETGKALSYVFIFLISLELFRDKNALKRFGFFVVGIGVCLSLVGLIFYRLSPHKVYGIFQFEQAASFTPYLNKNHFPNYLIMTLSMTAALMCLTIDRSAFSKASKFRSKLIWFSSREATPFLVLLGCFVIQLVAFFIPASRGGLLGLSAAIGMFGVLLLLKFQKKASVIVLISGLVFLLIFGVNQSKPLLYKFKLLHQTQKADDAVQFRWSNWKDATRMFLDFPISGIGIGGYYILFPYYKSLPEASYTSQTNFYHAENEFLEGLVEQGVIGLSLMFLLGISIYLSFYKMWIKTTSKTIHWLSLGLVSACFGMLAHSVVDFPLHIPANVALFAVCAGSIAGITMIDGTLGESFENNKLKILFGSLFFGFVVIGTIFSGVPISRFLWNQWRSDFYYSEAKDDLNFLNSRQKIPYAMAVHLFEVLGQAKKYGPNQARIYKALGEADFYLSLFSKDEAIRKNWLKESEAAFQKAFQLEPFDAYHSYKLGQLHQSKNEYQFAERYLKQAAELEPKNPFYQFEYGKNQLMLGNQSSALSLFNKTLRINGSYVRHILELLMDRNGTIDLEVLQFLLPEDEPERAATKRHLAAFFDQKNTTIAEAISRLP